MANLMVDNFIEQYKIGNNEAMNWVKVNEVEIGIINFSHEDMIKLADEFCLKLAEIEISSDLLPSDKFLEILNPIKVFFNASSTIFSIKYPKNDAQALDFIETAELIALRLLGSGPDKMGLLLLKNEQVKMVLKNIIGRAAALLAEFKPAPEVEHEKLQQLLGVHATLIDRIANLVKEQRDASLTTEVTPVEMPAVVSPVLPFESASSSSDLRQQEVVVAEIDDLEQGDVRVTPVEMPAVVSSKLPFENASSSSDLRQQTVVVAERDDLEAEKAKVTPVVNQWNAPSVVSFQKPSSCCNVTEAPVFVDEPPTMVDALPIALSQASTYRNNQVTPRSGMDCSFTLKLLSAISIFAGGIATLIVGAVLLQPLLIGIGIAATGVGIGLGIYGFYSRKSHAMDDKQEAISPMTTAYA